MFRPDLWRQYCLFASMSLPLCVYLPFRNATPVGLGLTWGPLFTVTFLKALSLNAVTFCGCCCSVAPSCLTLCNPLNFSTPGFPVLHHLLDWVCSHSCALSQWCLPIISSSVILFSSRLQSFPVSGSFQMSQFFTLGDQKVLELQLQYQSFQWTVRTNLL